MSESIIPQRDVRLESYTVWGIGGPAQYFFKPLSIPHLQAYLASRPVDEPIHLLGLGSNVLIPDEGLRGSVIVLTPGLNQVEQLSPTRVRFEAGVTCAKVARFAEKLGLDEAAFWAGIPGTIGGALAMNAGCFGGSTWNHVVSIETLDLRGERYTRFPDEYDIAYRSVTPPGREIFIAVSFEFPLKLPDNEAKPIRDLLQKRSESQPIGLRSCGSVFKNPPGDFAARLIEAAQLKGKRQGGAVISSKHANFIINEGGACAQDILVLIRLIQTTVYERFQVRLEPEVILWDQEGKIIHES